MTQRIVHMLAFRFIAGPGLLFFRLAQTTYPLSSKLYTYCILFLVFFVKELEFFYISTGMSLKMGDNILTFAVSKLIALKLTTLSLNKFIHYKEKRM